MNAPALRRAAAAAFAAAAAAAAGAAAAVAFAQTAGTPTGNFGGGAIAVPVDEDTVARDMLLSVRAQASGNAGIDGQIFTSCGAGTIKGVAKLAADGSFTLRGSARRRPMVGVTETTTFVVRGSLTADGGSGTARATLRIDPRRGETKTCRSRTVSWTVRRVGAAAAPAAAPAAATTLFGLTSQKASRARHAVVLRTADGGRSIERFLIAYRAKCDRGRVVVFDEQNFSPQFDVAADGSFRNVERFTLRYADVVARTTVVVRGQFDQAGGAAGRLSVTERFSSRRTGRRVDVCSTGTRSWSARP